MILAKLSLTLSCLCVCMRVRVRVRVRGCTSGMLVLMHRASLPLSAVTCCGVIQSPPAWLCLPRRQACCMCVWRTRQTEIGQ